MEVELNRTAPSHAVMEEALFPQRSIPCPLLVNRTSHTQARAMPDAIGTDRPCSGGAVQPTEVCSVKS